MSKSKLRLKRTENVQKKCNGYGCKHIEMCEHHKEYKKKTKTKGKWINADRCINDNYREFKIEEKKYAT